MEKETVRRQAPPLDFARVLFVSLLLNPVVSFASPADYGLILDLGIIRTDNIFLAPNNFEEDETVYIIAPEFFLTKNSERLDASLHYRPERYFYSNFDDSDELFDSLNASLTTALVKEHLFLNLSAVRFQSIITPDGQFPTTNLPINGNRIDFRTYEVRPYWQQQLGQADLLAQIGYLDAEYDSDLFQSHNGRYGLLQLNNIESQQGLAWGLDYQYRRIEYELSLPWEFQRAAASLGIWVNRGLRIFAVGGAETAFDNILASNLDDEFWEAGFQYKPNQRMDLELATGERSFGTSFRGNFSYKLRRGDISITYADEPSTRGELLFERRPVPGGNNLDNVLDQPGQSDRFIRRRGEFRASIDLSKSELTLQIFAERRENRTTAGGDALGDEEHSGVALRWSWNVGTKTTFGLGAGISERDQEGRRDELLTANIDLAYNFSERLSVRLEGMHSSQDATGSNIFDYDENQIRLMLRTEF